MVARRDGVQLALGMEWAAGDHMPWAVLDQRLRGTEFLRVPVRTVLNGPESTGMGFWSLNPYIGCEFGCAYCYARDTHRWTMEKARGSAPDCASAYDEFERRILVKADAPEVLARTLDPARLAGHTLVIGTATDPYQPAERRFRLTRRLLEALLPHRGLSIGLITKSPLVTRDLDVLASLAERHDLTVNISLITTDATLARRLEARSPAPHARLRALAALRAQGLRAGLLVMPIIPGITDGWQQLADLMAAAKEAGACYVAGGALRLGPATRARFLPHLEREFPELAERYRRHFATSDYTSRAYSEALKRRLSALQETFGFPVEARGRGRRQVEARPQGRAQRGEVAQPTLL
ncbi:MAG: SPL family radical SAM protein [Gemmatimonadota bacterium]